jgi:hypothetical protein
VEVLLLAEARQRFERDYLVVCLLTDGTWLTRLVPQPHRVLSVDAKTN